MGALRLKNQYAMFKKLVCQWVNEWRPQEQKQFRICYASKF